MPEVSAAYFYEASILLPYIVPLLQTCLTISVYSTVAITIHGLHEIRKSTKMSLPSPQFPSNNVDGIEYHSVISTSGNDS